MTAALVIAGYSSCRSCILGLISCTMAVHFSMGATLVPCTPVNIACTLVHCNKPDIHETVLSRGSAELYGQCHDVITADDPLALSMESQLRSTWSL